MISLYDNLMRPGDLSEVVRTLRGGGVIVYPTDSVYAFGCDAGCRSAVERICRLRNITDKRPQLAIVCESIAQVRQFTLFTDDTFKLMRSCLPGPYTFILEGSNRLPKLYRDRKTIGIRIPNLPVVAQLLEAYGSPLMTASLRTEPDEDIEYMTDPSLIGERYGRDVDLIIDGGIGGTTPSSVIDCTGDESELLRGTWPD